MQGFCAVGTTERALQSLSAYPWKWILSPFGPFHNARTRPYVCDNGAFPCHLKGKPFDDARFLKFLDKYGSEAEWVVCPDAVGDKSRTLEMASEWLPALSEHRLLLALQDGMTEEDILPFIDQIHGIFLGGSSEWKEASMFQWGIIARKHGLYYHVGRVNTVRRIKKCMRSNVDSFDGSGMAKFSAHGEFISQWMSQHVLDREQLSFRF